MFTLAKRQNKERSLCIIKNTRLLNVPLRKQLFHNAMHKGNGGATHSCKMLKEIMTSGKTAK